MEGTLEGRALANALRVLQRERATGILTVQGKEEIIAFSLLAGKVVSADALNQSLEDGLGEVLIKERLIDVEDFAGLVAEYQAGGGRVTELLIERSYLTREQLLGSLRRLTYRLSRQALAWKRGEFRFYRGDDVAYEAGVVPIDVDELLVRASDDLGASGPFGDHASPTDQVFRPVLETDSDGALPAEVLAENREEAEEVYRAFDGVRDVEALARDLGVSIYTVRALSAHWLECGLIEKHSGAAGRESSLKETSSVAGPIADLGLEALLLDSPDTTDMSDTTDSSLQVEPPSSAEAVAPERKPAAARAPGSVPLWLPRLMALALFGAVVGVLVAFAGRLLLPFPWQGGLRDAFDSERERLSIHKIDRAVTTFFLLEGRYPEDLYQVVSDRLLAPEAIVDSAGRRFEYSAGPASYVVRRSSITEGADSGWSGAIAGNFLLDPQFLVAEAGSEPPLVLLD